MVPTCSPGCLRALFGLLLVLQGGELLCQYITLDTSRATSARREVVQLPRKTEDYTFDTVDMRRLPRVAEEADDVMLDTCGRLVRIWPYHLEDDRLTSLFLGQDSLRVKTGTSTYSSAADQSSYRQFSYISGIGVSVVDSVAPLRTKLVTTFDPVSCSSDTSYYYRGILSKRSEVANGETTVTYHSHSELYFPYLQIEFAGKAIRDAYVDISLRLSSRAGPQSVVLSVSNYNYDVITDGGVSDPSHALSVVSGDTMGFTLRLYLPKGHVYQSGELHLFVTNAAAAAITIPIYTERYSVPYSSTGSTVSVYRTSEYLLLPGFGTYAEVGLYRDGRLLSMKATDVSPSRIDLRTLPLGKYELKVSHCHGGERFLIELLK